MWVRTLLALVVTLAAVSGLIAVLGANPIVAWKAIIKGSLGSLFNVGQTITVAGILILTGLAAAVPFSARLWNVGGEGQMTLGAIAAAILGIVLPATLPRWLLVPVIVLCAAAAGALFAAIPGYLKARFDASEVVVTLMLNFVATFGAVWVISEGWPEGFVQRTRSVSENASLPRPFPGTLVDVGIFVALAAVVVGWVLLSRTSLGFEIRAMGANARASLLAGIKTTRVTVVAFLIAGAFAGLAGALIVLGRDRSLLQNFSANFGFLGIGVALVGRLKPPAILPAAILFAILRVGSNNLQAAAGLTPSVGEVIVAVLVILLMVAGVIRFRYPESSSAH
jgi:simple sugar transport system permease protein